MCSARKMLLDAANSVTMVFCVVDMNDLVIVHTWPNGGGANTSIHTASFARYTAKSTKGIEHTTIWSYF